VLIRKKKVKNFTNSRNKSPKLLSTLSMEKGNVDIGDYG
jgi:hypothetical protein